MNEKTHVKLEGVWSHEPSTGERKILLDIHLYRLDPREIRPHRVTASIVPQAKRSFMPRGMALLMLVGIEDLGDQPLMLPVDHVGYRLPQQEGLCPFARTLVDIRDDLHDSQAFGIGEDILREGYFTLDTRSGAWSWTYPRQTPTPVEWAKIVAGPR